MDETPAKKKKRKGINKKNIQQEQSPENEAPARLSSLEANHGHDGVELRNKGRGGARLGGGGGVVGGGGGGGGGI